MREMFAAVDKILCENPEAPITRRFTNADVTDAGRKLEA